MVEVKKTNTHLDTEVSPIHVVAQEEIACVAGRPPHFKQLHEVKELAVDVSAHWGTHTHTHTMKVPEKFQDDPFGF